MSHVISWRLYQDTDKEAVLRLHGEMEAKLGCKLNLPDLLSEPVLIALVGERNGEVVTGIFLEAEAEVSIIGIRPMLLSQFAPAEQMLLDVLHRFKIQIVRAFVPHRALREDQNRRKASPLARILMRLGFTREGPNSIQFYRWL